MFTILKVKEEIDRARSIVGMTYDGQIVVYKGEDGHIDVDVNVDNNEPWVTIRGMSELFEKPEDELYNILQHYIDAGELVRAEAVRILPDPTTGKEVAHYSLEAVIFVSFVVQASSVGRHFRKWAAGKLGDFLVKGFIVNPDRVAYDTGHFMELLRQVRAIRFSERNLYNQIVDILALCPDYDRTSAETRLYFQSIQNKLHYAVTHQTAPQLIMSRCDSGKRNMGMTSWRGDQIKLSDTRNAKNYLTAAELQEMHSIGNQFFDLAESLARRHVILTMDEWKMKLDSILRINQLDILENAGDVKTEVAYAYAKEQFNQYGRNLPRGGDLPDAG